MKRVLFLLLLSLIFPSVASAASSPGPSEFGGAFSSYNREPFEVRKLRAIERGLALFRQELFQNQLKPALSKDTRVGDCKGLYVMNSLGVYGFVLSDTHVQYPLQEREGFVFFRKLEVFLLKERVVKTIYLSRWRSYRSKREEEKFEFAEFNESTSVWKTEVIFENHHLFNLSVAGEGEKIFLLELARKAPRIELIKIP